MNILAPVSSYESAYNLIQAGCDEIYLGGDENLFRTYSFSGRGKSNIIGNKISVDMNEVKEIVQMAHENQVKVNFTANTQFFSDSVQRKGQLEAEYLKHIEQAIDSGVDALIVGDMGLLQKLSKQKYDVSLHASVYLKTTNQEQITFLKEFGVDRVILSYQITIDEIEKFCKEKIMDYEVIGYIGCSFFNGACGFLHGIGEGHLDKFNPGLSCKAVYNVFNGEKTEKTDLFNVEAACCACVLKKLDNFGVNALKVVGRGADYKALIEVIKFYKRVLESDPEESAQLFLPEWWDMFFCNRRSCKYSSNNPNYLYTIGGE